MSSNQILLAVTDCWSDLVFSMSVADHRRGPNIWFYQLGLAVKDNISPIGWKMKSLDSIMKYTFDAGVSTNRTRFDDTADKLYIPGVY